MDVDSGNNRLRTVKN